MRIDEYGVLRLFEGGDADSAAANDAAAADAAAADAANSPAGASTIAGYGGMGDVSVNPNPVADEASNLTQSDLQALSAAGLGGLQGINPNNPTQSVDEAIAANNVHAALNFGLPTVMGLAVPGFGPALSLAKGIGALTSGQISPAQFGGQLGLAALSHVTGIPTGVLGPALSGNIGQSATNAGLSLGQMALSQATGLPPGIVGLGMQAAFGGQPGAIGQGATSIGNTVGGQIDFSGVGGSESYDPTEVLKATTPRAVSGYLPYELANVSPGLSKSPYGYSPYGA